MHTYRDDFCLLSFQAEEHSALWSPQTGLAIMELTLDYVMQVKVAEKSVRLAATQTALACLQYQWNH